MAKKLSPRRQRLRFALLLCTFLLFPIVMNYLSPYIIIDAASQGIINGSFLLFAGLFVSSLLLGRAWCGWACPAAGVQEACFIANEKPAPGGGRNAIKWGIWVIWIGAIAAMTISAGGYHSVRPFYLTESGVSLDRIQGYFIYYIVLLLVLVLSFAAGRRGFCHYACWMAPFMIIGRWLRNRLAWPSLRLRAHTPACTKCQTCTQHCPMSLDVMGMVQSGGMEHSECILCGSCVDHCPKDVIAYSFSAGKK